MVDVKYSSSSISVWLMVFGTPDGSHNNNKNHPILVVVIFTGNLEVVKPMIHGQINFPPLLLFAESSFNYEGLVWTLLSIYFQLLLSKYYSLGSKSWPQNCLISYLDSTPFFRVTKISLLFLHGTIFLNVRWRKNLSLSLECLFWGGLVRNKFLLANLHILVHTETVL